MQVLISAANKDYKSKRAAWFKIIEDYSTSDESQINYCKQRVINTDHIAYYLGCWCKANTKNTKITSFMELQVTDDLPDKWIINIGHGIKLEISDAISMQQLTELILNIRAKSC